MTEPTFNMQVPESQVAGVLADFVAVTHNANYFTLDFAAIGSTVSTGPDTVDVNCQVVSRIKILPDQVFEIMKALEIQLSQWESEARKPKPGSPGEPQPDAP